MSIYQKGEEKIKILNNIQAADIYSERYNYDLTPSELIKKIQKAEQLAINKGFTNIKVRIESVEDIDHYGRLHLIGDHVE